MNNEVIFRQIRDLILQGQINLPSLPEIALRVQEAAAKHNSTVMTLHREIMRDPAIAARLIQVANSAAYAAFSTVTNLRDAINRLSFTRVSKLVMAESMKQLFHTNKRALKATMHDIWQQSNDVAATCNVLAGRFNHLDNDEAMLAGLVHKIGCLPILALDSALPELANDMALLNEAMDKLHQEIGLRIMNSWNFPDSTKIAVREYRNVDREHEGPVDCADIVQAAWLERQMAKQPDKIADFSQLPVYRRLGFVPEVDFIGLEWSDMAND